MQPQSNQAPSHNGTWHAAADLHWWEIGVDLIQKGLGGCYSMTSNILDN